MALNPSNSSNLDQLVLKGLITFHIIVVVFLVVTLTSVFTYLLYTSHHEQGI